MKIDTKDLVSNTEISEMAGVGSTAVSNWTVRHDDFPKPVLVLARGRIQLRRRSEVAAWLKKRT